MDSRVTSVDYGVEQIRIVQRSLRSIFFCFIKFRFILGKLRDYKRLKERPLDHEKFFMNLNIQLSRQSNRVNDRGSIPGRTNSFSLFHSVHTCSGAHRAIPGTISAGVKRQRRDADHLQCRDQDQWSSVSTPPHICISQCLIKHRDTFMFFTLIFH